MRSLAESAHHLGAYEEGYQAAISGVGARCALGVHPTDDYGPDFLVCFSGGLQVDASGSFPVYSLACLRYVSMVLVQ